MAYYFKSPHVPYEVGYEMVPQRKRPQLVIRVGNKGETYGSFRDEQAAEEYFLKLVELLGVKEIVEGDTNE